MSQGDLQRPEAREVYCHLSAGRKSQRAPKVAKQVGPSKLKRLHSTPSHTLWIVGKRTGPAEQALEHNSRQVKEYDSRILVATYPEEKEGPLRLSSQQKKAWQQDTTRRATHRATAALNYASKCPVCNNADMFNIRRYEGVQFPSSKLFSGNVFNKLRSECKAAVLNDLGGCNRCKREETRHKAVVKIN